MANAERAARLSAGISKAFGEDFTFAARKAQADVDLPHVADTSRATFTASGAYTGGTKLRHAKARGHADNHAQGEVVSAPRADFAAADLPWTPIEGDLCTRVETGEVYAVARALPNGFGRMLVYFTARKR